MASAIGGLTSPINHAVPVELGARVRLREATRSTTLGSAPLRLLVPPQTQGTHSRVHIHNRRFIAIHRSDRATHPPHDLLRPLREVPATRLHAWGGPVGCSLGVAIDVRIRRNRHPYCDCSTQCTKSAHLSPRHTISLPNSHNLLFAITVVMGLIRRRAPVFSWSREPWLACGDALALPARSVPHRPCRRRAGRDRCAPPHRRPSPPRRRAGRASAARSCPNRAPADNARPTNAAPI
jgi:hypothetical protein